MKYLIPCVALLLWGCASPHAARQEAGLPSGSSGSDGSVVMQPGAPGASTRVFESAEDIELQRPPHTAADTHFMQGMIHHHAQALEMSELVPERTARRDVRMLGKRIHVSQASEIALMRDWLERRGEETHAARMHMPGMLSAAQMDELQSASGRDFDSLFLTYMIMHHEGAITMVRDLFASPGAAADQIVSEFATDVDMDQRAEIARMRAMLANN